MPNEDEFSLAAATAVGAEEAIGGVRDGGLHRTPAHLRYEVVASETDMVWHQNPSEFVSSGADGPIGTE